MHELYICQECDGIIEEPAELIPFSGFGETIYFAFCQECVGGEP